MSSKNNRVEIDPTIYDLETFIKILEQEIYNNKTYSSLKTIQLISLFKRIEQIIKKDKDKCTEETKQTTNEMATLEIKPTPPIHPDGLSEIRYATKHQKLN